MFYKSHKIADFDSEVANAIAAEAMRQEQHIELIASENYTSPLVLEAQGSIFTNKYAEGYPQKRYYGGCKHADEVETLAIDRAKKLFGADFANVQPHSGSSANAAVYHAILNPGDTVLGMSLAHGGHLTHGASVNFSGYIYNAVSYKTDENGLLDYNEIEHLAKKHKPKMIIAGFSAYSRIMDWQKFRDIADSINAVLFVDMAHVAGLVATGLYPSPVQIADVVTTTTHKTLRGARGGLILARSNELIEKKINSKIFPGTQGGPLLQAIAGKAICFKEAMSDSFKSYQKQVLKNAKVLSENLIGKGYDIVSGGTDNHLFLMDLTKKQLTGVEVDRWLGDNRITVNKNSVPNDPQSPFVTSGIRIGTPAITTRGFNEDDCSNLADWIHAVIECKGSRSDLESVHQAIEETCARLPVYK